MRLRNVSYAKALLESHPELVLTSLSQYKGRWSDAFGRSAPLHVEIGMGKGRFLCGMAERHPEVNFLGLDRYESVVLRALQALLKTTLTHVRLCAVLAEHLDETFAEGELNRIYLNFSDPWPKKAHAKRRLTHRSFLERYRNVLAPGAEIHLKTDNRELFDFSLEEMSALGLSISELEWDLHAHEPPDNVRTEYEETWSSKGFPIHRLVARFH